MLKKAANVDAGTVQIKFRLQLVLRTYLTDTQLSPHPRSPSVANNFHYTSNNIDGAFCTYDLEL